MDTDYVATMDDSGGIAPLVTWGGEYAEGDHPITFITTLVLKRERLQEFNAAWIALRTDIREQLQCDELPPIHLRLMYGKELPRRYRGRPNPYVGCDFADVLSWIRQGLQIVEDFRRHPRTMTWNTKFETRERLAEGILRYFSDEQLAAEVNFLKSQGRRTGKRSFAQRYVRRMASPLLPILVRQIMQLNEIMRQLGGKTVLLKLDPFPEARGMDAQEIVEIINGLAKLPHIAAIEVMADSDQEQLAQAVDLIGFILFRRVMFAYGFMNEDKPLFSIMEEVSGQHKFINADVRHIVERRISKNPALTTAVHYAVARSVIEEEDPDFANTHLLTVEEFYQAAQALPKGGKGHSILKPATRRLL